MALARLHCVFLLLLYSKESFGQQVGLNNQNGGTNNAFGMQQQGFQRPTNNINQMPNGPNGINGNIAQPNLQSSNLQLPNFQSAPSSPATNQGNSQQLSNLPPNLQSQGVNNMQITKIGFSPVTPSFGNPSAPSMQFQNTDIGPYGQMMPQSQFQNTPCSNSPVSQVANGPTSTLTLGDIVGLKGQSLLSLMNAQNTNQLQQNQQNSVPNIAHGQNQLSDVQKQFLARSFQAHHDAASNPQVISIMQTQPRAITMDNQQAITVQTVPSPQLAPAVITPLGKPPPYITVQAKPLDEYLKQQTVTGDPIMSMVLSEYGPQYTISAAPQKKSKLSLKSLIPLIMSLLKEKKFCSCDNCKCESNTCQNNSDFSASIESEIAQIFGGYSSQKTYGANAKDLANTSSKKTLEHESKSNDKHKKTKKKIMVPLETEEISDEDDSEYEDDD